MSITFGKSLRLNSGRCPCCDARLTGITPVDGALGPKNGDASICIYCAELLIFQADLSLRIMTPRERKTFLKNDKNVQLHNAAREAAERRGIR